MVSLLPPPLLLLISLLVCIYVQYMYLPFNWIADDVQRSSCFYFSSPHQSWDYRPVPAFLPALCILRLFYVCPHVCIVNILGPSHLLISVYLYSAISFGLATTIEGILWQNSCVLIRKHKLDAYYNILDSFNISRSEQGQNCFEKLASVAHTQEFNRNNFS